MGDLSDTPESTLFGSQTAAEAALFAQLNGDPATAMMLVLGMSPEDQQALAKACQSLIAFVPVDKREAAQH